MSDFEQDPRPKLTRTEIREALPVVKKVLEKIQLLAFTINSQELPEDTTNEEFTKKTIHDLAQELDTRQGTISTLLAEILYYNVSFMCLEFEARDTLSDQNILAIDLLSSLIIMLNPVLLPYTPQHNTEVLARIHNPWEDTNGVFRIPSFNHYLN